MFLPKTGRFQMVCNNRTFDKIPTCLPAPPMCTIPNVTNAIGRTSAPNIPLSFGPIGTGQGGESNARGSPGGKG